MAKSLAGEPLSSSAGWRPKKKGNKGWWGALVILILVASVVAGFHYGGQRLLKHHADQQAVAAVALPVPAEERPEVTEWKIEGHGQTLAYGFVVFPNGLECLVANRHMTCNWAKFNADREAPAQ